MDAKPVRAASAQLSALSKCLPSTSHSSPGTAPPCTTWTETAANTTTDGTAGIPEPWFPDVLAGAAIPGVLISFLRIAAPAALAGNRSGGPVEY